jgi:hypothetical protein
MESCLPIGATNRRCFCRLLVWGADSRCWLLISCAITQAKNGDIGSV